MRRTRRISNWFNPAAFALPAKGTWGNLGRYIANGPGMYEVDTTLQKRFPIKERSGSELPGLGLQLVQSSGL